MNKNFLAIAAAVAGIVAVCGTVVGLIKKHNNKIKRELEDEAANAEPLEESADEDDDDERVTLDDTDETVYVDEDSAKFDSGEKIIKDDDVPSGAAEEKTEDKKEEEKDDEKSK